MGYIDELIFHLLDAQALVVAFFGHAHLLTMNYWSNELRTKDTSNLEELIIARTGWAHFWHCTSPLLALLLWVPATICDCSLPI